MAASMRSIVRFSLNQSQSCFRASIVPFRNLRVDAEEELDRLFIKKSFEERISELKTVKPKPRLIGAQPSCVHKGGTSSRASRLKARLTNNVANETSTPSEFSVDEVHQDFLFENDSKHSLSILNHYEIFEHLFKDNVYFYPQPTVNFSIAYKVGSEEVLPVYRGNRVLPTETSTQPIVQWCGESNKFYSVLFLSLDGHLSKFDWEYLHWYCVNVKGEHGAESGESCPYLQAMPLRGTGFHRYVFLLLEHSKPIDLKMLPTIDVHNLQSRSFCFSDFYASMSDDVVPVGIQFFQSEWDPSVKDVFHNLLDMPEPAYNYDYPEKERKVQVKYPPKQPFQSYLDQFRDRKEIAEEVLKEHLSEITPFKPLEDQVLPYPLARPTKPGLYPEHLPPTWMEKNLKHKANKTGKYQYIYAQD